MKPRTVGRLIVFGMLWIGVTVPVIYWAASQNEAFGILLPIFAVAAREIYRQAVLETRIRQSHASIP